MKKIISLILALACFLSLCSSASAMRVVKEDESEAVGVNKSASTDERLKEAFRERNYNDLSNLETKSIDETFELYNKTKNTTTNVEYVLEGNKIIKEVRTGAQNYTINGNISSQFISVEGTL